MIVDPVCGKQIDDVEYPEREEYAGEIYFFDSLECAQKFRENPEVYAKGHEDLGEPYPEYASR